MKSNDSLVNAVFFENKKGKTFQDSLEMSNEIKLFKESLHRKGYLNPNIELIKKNDTNFSIKLIKEKQHTHITLIFNDLTKSKKIKQQKTTIPIYILEKKLQNIVKNLESEGATFSRVKLANIRSIDHKLIADVIIDPSRKRTIDKVIIGPYENFPNRYIKHYFKIKKGKTTYNLEKTKNISQQSKLLNFASEIKKPETLFSKDSTNLYLYLKQIKGNKFDGVLGFGNNKEKKGIQFNGHIDIELLNTFNKGEKFKLKWSRNNTELEKLHTKIISPYVFNSRITSKIKFELKKQDSTFINTKAQIQLETSLGKNQNIGILVNQTKSSALRTTAKNDMESFKTRSYGFSYTNSSFIKKNKINTEILIEYGIKHTALEEIPQTRSTASITLTTPIKGIRNYFIKNVTKFLNSDKQNTNELYITGGANSLRGFNEDSILSSGFNYTNSEIRFRTSETSYLYSFLDAGIFINKITQTLTKLYGLGAGYTFKTKNGNLDLSYGLGNNTNEKLDLQKGIFHIKTTIDF
ncbi:MAG: hypothetical protein ACPHXR_05335 [Flavicella sp.]